jgi:hypothetical protein
VESATSSPRQTAAPAASEPVATAEVVQPSDAPADSLEPSIDPYASPEDSALPSAGPAALCSGTDANRAFFQTVADHVAWDVYCAVLPKGWIVDTGSYRTSGSGWLKIAYKASGGRRLELSEGAFCATADGCAPAGTEIESGPFGDREAHAIAAADGSFAMVVDPGSKVSWLLIGKGIDESTFRAQAEALIRVAGQSAGLD